MAQSDNSRKNPGTKKPGDSTSDDKDQIIDAEVIEDTPADKKEEQAASENAAEDDASEEAAAEATGEEPESAVEPVLVEGDDLTAQDGDDSGSDDKETPAEEKPSEGEEADTPATLPQPVQRETVVEKRGGIVTMLMGGVLAGGVGFLGAQYPDEWPFGGAGEPSAFESEVREALDSQNNSYATQQDALAALTGRINTLESAPAPEIPAVPEIDLGPLSDALANLDQRTATLEQGVADVAAQLAEMAGQVSAMTTRDDQFNDRINTLERASVEATVPPDVIQSYERDLETLRDAIAAQRANLTEVAEQQAQALSSAIAAQEESLKQAAEAQQAEIAAIAAEAAQAEASAAEKAQLARARTAFAEVTAALESGVPFADALALAAEGRETPSALAAVATDGVPTQSELANSFPDAARDALRAARAEDDDAGSLTGFFKTQLGVRSVTPREGDDPDAVLSRAEAAVRSGDLSAALSEIETLPPKVTDAMGNWPGAAAARVAALDAADVLGQQLNEE